MSVGDVYRKAQKYGRCRVCGAKVNKDDLKRGRCPSCNYKNLQPIE
jgi:DNA-directed RNA polymerase subunit RPC12/RpoP